MQAAKDHQDVLAALPAYIHEAILRAYIAASAKRTLREEDMRLYIAPWLTKDEQKAFWRQVAQMDDRYSTEVGWRYDEIRCPVKILWGAEDEFIPLKDGEELARRIPGAPLTVVPDANTSSRRTRRRQLSRLPSISGNRSLEILGRESAFSYLSVCKLRRGIATKAPMLSLALNVPTYRLFGTILFLRSSRPRTLGLGPERGTCWDRPKLLGNS